jgi:hypothetical protein
MTTRIPNCSCGGDWGCYECGSRLRVKLAPAADQVLNVWGSPDVQQYLKAVRDQKLYTLTFRKGPRGGALLDLGDGNELECFLPFVDDTSGDLVPYMPMELDGSVVHDPGRGKTAESWMIEECERGSCNCDSRPRGWKLTRPLIRGLLGVSDSFLADHAGELPGRQPCWCLCVSTPEFMREVIFNPEFKFPTREAARAARAVREAARRCKPGRPTGRWPSRPRRKR